MTTRIQKFSIATEKLSSQYSRWFSVILAACLVILLSTISLAFKTLLAGPIGVELKEPFLNTGISRLYVLQISTSLSVLFLGTCIYLFFHWEHAQRWRWIVFAKGFFRHMELCFTRSALQSDAPGNAFLYWGCIALSALWVNYAVLYDLPGIPCIEPDTISYLSPSPIRSAGYMMLIDAIYFFTGDIKWMVPAQLNVILLSFATLGWSLRNYLNNQIFGLMAALVPMLSAGLLILTPTIMTEALFTALICFHITAVLSLLRHYSHMALMMIGLTLALMIIIRPNGISFLIGLPVLAYFYKEKWRSCLLYMASPVIVIILAQCLYNEKTFGFFGLHSFGDIIFAANVAPIYHPDMPSEYPELSAGLGHSLAYYARDFPSFKERRWPFEMAEVASITAVGAIYGEILPAIRKQLGLPAPKHVAFEYEPRVNAIARSLNLSAIQHNPFGFLKIISSNYIANWSLTLPIRVPMAIFYPRCLEIAQGVARENETLVSRVIDTGYFWEAELQSRINDVKSAGVRPIEWPRMVLGVFQLPLALFSFAISLTGIALILKRREDKDHGYRLLAYTSLTLQAGIGLISIGNASFARYTVVFDPLVIVMLLTAATMLIRYLFTDQGDERTSS